MIQRKQTDNLSGIAVSETNGDEPIPDDLPTLTEIAEVIEEQSARVLSDGEIKDLLQQLEAHIETLFTRKLSMRMEELQRTAIDQAMSELKAELPRLLQEALKVHPGSRQS